MNEDISRLMDGELDDDGAVDQNRQDEYERELEDLAVSTELARSSSSSLIDAATPPDTPFEPAPTRTATLALVVGLLIGVCAAFLVDYLDTTIRDDDDLQAATGLPTLGLIPMADLPGFSSPTAVGHTGEVVSMEIGVR